MIGEIFLPALNAILNATGALLLITGYLMIRRRRIALHKACMISALVASILFLTSYLVYHYHAGATPFTGTGSIRIVYFAILLTHTILAVLVPPMAGITFYRALKGNFERHKKIARWTLPIWLYVSITGVIVYWMLYHR